MRGIRVRLPGYGPENRPNHRCRRLEDRELSQSGRQHRLLGDVGGIYKAFQVGNSLYIKLGSEEFEEPLDGSSDAIDALMKCRDNLPARKK